MNRKRQSTEANNTTQMSELSEDFKAVFIKPLQQTITNMLETNEKQKASLSKDKEPNGNFRTGTQ